MRFHVGADHAGVELKSVLQKQLSDLGHEVFDHGTHSRDRVDYPDFAKAVSKAVQEDQRTETRSSSFGLLVCGSGIGVCMVANRFSEIRAVAACNAMQAQLARAHNDANVLCIGERLTTPTVAQAIVESFINTPFEGGRHMQRVQKIEGR